MLASGAGDSPGGLSPAQTRSPSCRRSRKRDGGRRSSTPPSAPWQSARGTRGSCCCSGNSPASPGSSATPSWITDTSGGGNCFERRTKKKPRVDSANGCHLLVGNGHRNIASGELPAEGLKVCRIKRLNSLKCLKSIVTSVT